MIPRAFIFLCNILQRLFSTAVERILIVSSFIFPPISRVSKLHLLFDQSLACERGVHMLSPVYIKNSIVYSWEIRLSQF
ncbi:hypothetical protein BJX65DRAFT_214898 [Aspergillus insuetus]